MRWLGSVLLLLLMSFCLKAETLEKPDEIPFWLEAGNGTFDSDEVQRLQDGVVFIYKDYFVYTDALAYFTNDGVIEAEGNVVLIHGNHFFIGEKLRFHLEKKTLEIVRGHIYLNTSSANDFRGEIFYHIPRAFSKYLGKHNEVVATRRQDLGVKRKKIIEHYKKQGADKELVQLFENYMILKEEIKRLVDQQTLSLSQSEATKQKILNRLKYYNSVKNKKVRFADVNIGAKGYYHFQGHFIKRDVKGEFFIDRGKLTPCLCAMDEIPPWAIAGKDIHIKVEEYLTVFHPVIMINDVPTFYLPWIKLPIKTKRQSGLLMPVIRSHRKHTGFSFGSQYYQVFNDQHDMTLGYDYYDKLGHRPSLEYRYAYQQNDGELFIQGIKDEYMRKSYPLKIEEHIDETVESEDLSEEDEKIRREDLEKSYPLLSPNRYYLNAHHRGVLGEEIFFRTRIKKVSDHLYFYHLDGNDAFSPRYVNSYVSFSRPFGPLYVDLMGSVMDDFQDVISENTVQRLPSIMVKSSYQSVFSLPVYYGWGVEFNRFNRLGGSAFDDGLTEEKEKNAQGEMVTLMKKNGKRDPGEPVREADQIDSVFELFLPIFDNDYVSGNFSVSGNHRFYRLPLGLKSQKQSYLHYRFFMRLPLDKRFYLPGVKSFYHMEHSIVPEIGWEYIPHVVRDRGYDMAFDSHDGLGKTHRILFNLSTAVQMKKERWEYQNPRISRKSLRKRKKRSRNIFQVAKKLEAPFKNRAIWQNDNQNDNEYDFAEDQEIDVNAMDLDNNNNQERVEEESLTDRSPSMEESSDEIARIYQAALSKEQKDVDNVQRVEEVLREKIEKKKFLEGRLHLNDQRTPRFLEEFYQEFPYQEPLIYESFDETTTDDGDWGLSYYKRQLISRSNPISISLSQPVNMNEYLDEKKEEDEKQPLDDLVINLWLNFPYATIYLKSFFEHYSTYQSPFSEVTATLTLSSPYWSLLAFKFVDHRTLFDHPEDLDENGAPSKVEERLRKLNVKFGFNLTRAINVSIELNRQLENEFVEVQQSIVYSFGYSPSSACWGLVGKITKEEIGSKDLIYEASFLLNFHKDWAQSYALTDIIRRTLIN